MIHFLLGHRGVGKTSLLQRIAAYASQAQVPCQTFDLDAEIESLAGRSISEIFESSGEAAFRKLEKESLDRILNQADHRRSVWIALGAGFEGTLPEDSRKIWVRRPTDSLGRVFLDRPRLEPGESPFNEYMSRLQIREQRYREWSGEELTLLEGFTEPSEWESVLLGFKEATAGGVLTILPERLKTLEGFRKFIGRRRKWGTSAFELRDDLFSFEQLQMAREVLEPREVIYSFRKSIRRPAEWSESRVDWALELGLPEGFEPEILSLHERQSSLGETLKDLPRQAGILKLAVEIHSFQELALGHEWWMENPERRSFLPRSQDGRWSWYRQLFGPRMPLSFWREGDGSAADQPLIGQWLKAPKEWKAFAAILGSPVVQSFTPAEQSEFFSGFHMPVVAVPVSEEGWNKDALEVLESLGLRAAAVTSPLKEKSVPLVLALTETAKSLNSVNTLVKAGNGWQGHNTDLIGMQSLALAKGETCVWGGGGTREVLKRIFPGAPLVSARTSVSERGNLAVDFNPETVVWAVGRSRMKSCAWPPPEWRPKIVIDLNYSEDSPGREYALMTGAKYQSGLPMFKAQAKAQREFWTQGFVSN